MDYTGTIIEESLTDKEVLKDLVISETKVGKSQPNTPHVSQWTLHTVAVPEDKADVIARRLSQSLDYSHCAWFADFRNDSDDYIIFKDKIFKIPRNDAIRYQQAKQYGISLGIPEYQVNFSHHIE